MQHYDEISFLQYTKLRYMHYAFHEFPAYNTCNLGKTLHNVHYHCNYQSINTIAGIHSPFRKHSREGEREEGKSDGPRAMRNLYLDGSLILITPILMTRIAPEWRSDVPSPYHLVYGKLLSSRLFSAHSRSVSRSAVKCDRPTQASAQFCRPFADYSLSRPS